MDRIQYIDKSTYVILYRVFSDHPSFEVPREIDGKAVRELADHAFSDQPSVLYDPSSIKSAVLTDGQWTVEKPESFCQKQPSPPALCGRALGKIVLADGLAAIGNYAFYGCDLLSSVTFPGSIRRIGSGLFNSCPALKSLIFISEQDSQSGGAVAPAIEAPFTPPLLQEVLRTINHELEVVVRLPDGRESYRLLFPEFYEEPKENTPARIIEIVWHGTGYQYRQCFLGRKLEFTKYDDILPMARAQEMPATIVRLCLDRLKAPVGLTEKKKGQYAATLRDYPGQLWEFISSDRETDLSLWIRILEDSGFFTSQIVDMMIDTAAGSGRGDASACLMDLRRRKFASHRTKYDF